MKWVREVSSVAVQNDFETTFLTYMLSKIDQWKRDVIEVCEAFEVDEEKKREALESLDKLEEEVLSLLIFH